MLISGNIGERKCNNHTGKRIVWKLQDKKERKKLWREVEKLITRLTASALTVYERPATNTTVHLYAESSPVGSIECLYKYNSPSLCRVLREGGKSLFATFFSPPFRKFGNASPPPFCSNRRL